LKFTETRLTWLRKIGERIYLTFRIRRAILISIILLGVIPSALLFNQPLFIRQVYAMVFSVLALASSSYITNLVAMPLVQMIGFSWYTRTHKPIEYSTPKIEQLKDKMGVSDKVKVYVTDSPWVKGMFCNMYSGKVYVHKEWIEKYPETEILGGISHEFGHYLKRNSWRTNLIVMLAITTSFTFFLSLNAIRGIFEMTVLALEMLLVTMASRRNEFQADKEGAINAGPEGLIALLEQLKYESKKDQGSETHPPLSERIKRLMKLLDSDITP